MLAINMLSSLNKDIIIIILLLSDCALATLVQHRLVREIINIQSPCSIAWDKGVYRSDTVVRSLCIFGVKMPPITSISTNSTATAPTFQATVDETWRP